MTELDVKDPLERVQRLLSRLKDDVGGEKELFDGQFYPYIIALSSVIAPRPSANPKAAPPTATTTFAFDVPSFACNRMRNLHGGATATVFDFVTTIALAPVASKGVFQYHGVTRQLNCSYLRPIPEGTHVVAVCDVLNIGGRLATIRGVFREGTEDGPVLAACEHTKVNIDAMINSKL